MPTSRKRKLTYSQQVKGAKKRVALYVANRDAAMPIYERALPGRQDYPPRSAAWAAERTVSREAQQHRERLASRHTGGIDGRRYEEQFDGSLRVIGKPRSRVKRLREERSDG